MNIDDRSVEHIADASPQQWAAWRKTLAEHAPDLLEMFKEDKP